MQGANGPRFPPLVVLKRCVQIETMPPLPLMINVQYTGAYSEHADLYHVSLQGGLVIAAGERLPAITSSGWEPGDEITETLYPCVISSTPSSTGKFWGSLSVTCADDSNLISKVLRVGSRHRWLTQKALNACQTEMMTLITELRGDTLDG